MTENNQQFQEVLEARRVQNDAIIAQVVEDLKDAFPDPKQHAVVSDIYTQVFNITGSMEELNHQGIFLSSYIDAFYEYLVGENKLITEEQFRTAAQAAYESSLEEVVKARQQITQTSE